MTPKEVLQYYGSTYGFHKKTGMSTSSLLNWLRAGRIPLESQLKIQVISNEELKIDLKVDKKRSYIKGGWDGMD